jgi:hypothetical protein
MREILYRGKRLDNREWMYGGIRIVQGRYYVIPEDSNPFDFEVDPATVGQYTGRTDVDGDKIFEGDFLSVLVFQPKGEYLPREVVIEWNEERASYIGVDIKDAEESWGIHWLKKSLIVGNRWDNPALLKGGKE